MKRRKHIHPSWVLTASCALRGDSYQLPIGVYFIWTVPECTVDKSENPDEAKQSTCPDGLDNGGAA